MKSLSLCLLVCVSLIASANAGCPPGGCNVATYTPAVEMKEGWYDGGGGWLKLYRRGELIGWLDPTVGQWQTNGKTHTLDLVQAFALRASAARPKECICKPNECDCKDCPHQCVARAVNDPPKFGMSWEPDGREHNSINGKHVDHSTLIEALGKGGSAADIPDDSGLPRMVVIGSEASRKKVLDDFALTKYAATTIAQSFSADQFLVNGYYPQTADPTIYLVDADGKLRHKSDGYFGPEHLSVALAKAEKLRQPVPGVDPLKTPDLGKPEPKDPAKDPPAPNPLDGITAEQAAMYGIPGALLAFALYVARCRQP